MRGRGTLQTEGGYNNIKIKKMDLKLPEDRLLELGFEVLDYIYGELTIKKGIVWDEVFVDKEGDGRLGYNKPGLKKQGFLGYLYKDREFFLNIIPVEVVDYERVLKAWVEEHYKREVDITRRCSPFRSAEVEEHYKREVDITIPISRSLKLVVEEHYNRNK